jgi:hypothetical protein
METRLKSRKERSQITQYYARQRRPTDINRHERQNEQNRERHRRTRKTRS